MPNKCVVCSSQASRKVGLSIHVFPFANDNRTEAQKRRQKWIDFVRQGRPKWTPGTTASLCSKHFTADDYERRFVLVPEVGKPLASRLKTDEFGVCVWPTIDDTPPKSKKRRQCSLSKNQNARRVVCFLTSLVFWYGLYMFIKLQPKRFLISSHNVPIAPCRLPQTVLSTWK